jgi:hypothetical protein
MHRLRCLVVIGVLVVAVSVVGAAPAVAAKGGNSANAKLCQKGGWQNLFQSDGSGFASEGDCVSYGAHGGTIFTSAGQAVCTADGGTFVPDGGPPIIWQCNLYPSGTNEQILANACFADGGNVLATRADPPLSTTTKSAVCAPA